MPLMHDLHRRKTHHEPTKIIHEFFDTHPDVKDIEKSSEDAKVTMKHFEAAVKKVREQKNLKIGEKLVASYFVSF